MVENVQTDPLPDMIVAPTLFAPDGPAIATVGVAAMASLKVAVTRRAPAG
ncbi:MAG: hypothetical protein HY816_13135 [Candidatus Wallbacteria bacterium]|nr:hypothetical protein [Candidatus Wallbacteria bacterium]